jgi:thiamine-phosphate pyrophosphorylase
MKTTLSRDTLRIIDANLNRLGEALRFLEEIARYTLDDEILSAGLKALRHSVAVTDMKTKAGLLTSRDALNDVGFDSSQTPVRGLPEAATANARRAEESLRVLEELAKLPGSGRDAAMFQEMRFQLYSLEKELTSRLLRSSIAARITGLYAVLDTSLLTGRDPTAIAEDILESGVGILQLRDKTASKRELLPMAEVLAEMCRRHEALFIVNDYLDVALASGADGVHLGQQDLPVTVARRLLGVDKIIGCSVENAVQAKQAKADGADYLAVGAMFPTPTKGECPVLGPKAAATVKKAVDLPLVAIGGINGKNLAHVLAAGADSVACVSAILCCDSPGLAARRLAERIKECHEQAD